MKSPADTRERILDAARQLFHERGYSNVGVAEICARAEVVKGSFYHFFPAKEDLLGEVVERNALRINELMVRLLEAPLPARASIERLFELVLLEARQCRRSGGQVLGCRLGTLASELGTRDVEARLRTRKAIENWRKSLRRLVRKGMRDGSIAPSADATATADALLASIQGMSVVGRATNSPAVLRGIAQAALRQVPAPE